MNANMERPLQWIWGRPQPLADGARMLIQQATERLDSLSNQRWHFFRKLLNKYDFKSRRLAVNRAFYKLWELLSSCRQQLCKPDCVTLHLAEAPGSFVQVIKTINPSGLAVAVSKPPCSYAEVVRKGRAIPTFSPIVTALPGTHFHYLDLASFPALCALKETVSPMAPEGFDLVTADGGFDEKERYNEKEMLHYKLILGEVLSILQTQRIGGSSVLKVFDTFTVTTLSILSLLCQHYETFEIVKPSTSRPTNSERYVVCHGFRGQKWSLSSLEELMRHEIRDGMVLNIDIPDAFRAYVINIAVKLASEQAAAIDSVLIFMRENEGVAFIDKRVFTEGKRKTFSVWKDRFGYEYG